MINVIRNTTIFRNGYISTKGLIDCTISQQARHIETMLVSCWPTVCVAGPTLNHHCFNVSCLGVHSSNIIDLISTQYNPPKTGHWPNVALMLKHRLWRWPSIKTTLIWLELFGDRYNIDGTGYTCVDDELYMLYNKRLSRVKNIQCDQSSSSPAPLWSTVTMMWMNIDLRRFRHNHGIIATEGSLETGLCPTLNEILQGFFIVRTILDSTANFRPLNTLEHCIYTQPRWQTSGPNRVSSSSRPWIDKPQIPNVETLLVSCFASMKITTPGNINIA